jgi:SAM-dependent methyltransferase
LALRKVIKAITPPIILSGVRRFSGRKPRSTPTDWQYHERKHRRSVGGAWEDVGKLQFDFMVEHGLQPSHRLLDVGCGSLRGGVQFVRYLEDGHYYGIDRKQWLLDAAVNIELPEAGLGDKTVHLLCRDDFDVSSFNVAFDYALSISVLTHLPWNSILRCLVNVQRALKPGGQYYATFFEDRGGSHMTTPIEQPFGGIITYPDQDPYHYTFDVFEELAQRVGLNVTYIGEWQHPRNQMMMVFTQPE